MNPQHRFRQRQCMGSRLRSRFHQRRTSTRMREMEGHRCIRCCQNHQRSRRAAAQRRSRGLHIRSGWRSQGNQQWKMSSMSRSYPGPSQVKLLPCYASPTPQGHRFLPQSKVRNEWQSSSGERSPSSQPNGSAQQTPRKSSQ